MKIVHFDGNGSNSLRWSGGRGAETPLCFEMGYREPTRAESRAGASALADSSRVFFDVVILNFDCRTKFRVFRSQFWMAAENFSVLGEIRV